MVFIESFSSSSSRTLFSLLLVIAVALQTATLGQAKNIAIDGWQLPYTGPTAVEANVGDTITFQWGAGHNVYIHPTMDCNLEGAILVGTTSPTEYTFTADDGSVEGTEMYFSCDIGDGAHCKAGQNLIATVYSGDGDSGSSDTTVDAPADTDAPADVPAPVATNSSSTTTNNEPPVETDVGTSTLAPADLPVTEPSSSSSNGNHSHNNKMTMILGMMVLSVMMMFR